MTDDQMTELIGLYLDNALPESLLHVVEEYLVTHPDAARDAAELRETAALLTNAPQPRPDSWFVERALDGLLRENWASEGMTRKLGT